MSFPTGKKITRAIIFQTGSFTLIEILVSIGILAVIVSMAIVGLGAYKGRTVFNLDASQIVAVLRNAQSRAMSQDRGQGWGVQFTNSTTTGSRYALFWGTSYTTSSVVSAGTLGYSSVFTDPAPGFSKTITFAPMTGASAGPDVVVIKNTTSNNVAIITVSALGLVGETTESGLAGYWAMDEGAGTSAYDASGNGNGGTLMNGPTWAVGEAGWALSLDGVNDYVNFGNANNLNISNAITVSAWVNLPIGYSASHKMIASKGSGAWYLSIYNNKAFFSPWINGSQRYVQGTKIVSGGAWHYVAASWDATTGVYRTYLDGGVDVDTVIAGTALSLNASNQVSGYFNSPGDYPFVGQIDDVRVYNRALSAAEIKNIFNAY